MSGHKPVDYAALDRRSMGHHMKLTREQRDAVTKRPEGRMTPHEAMQQTAFLRAQERRVPYYVRAGAKAPWVRFAHVAGEPYEMPADELKALRRHPRTNDLTVPQALELPERDCCRILEAQAKRDRRAALRREQADRTAAGQAEALKRIYWEPLPTGTMRHGQWRPRELWVRSPRDREAKLRQLAAHYGASEVILTRRETMGIDYGFEVTR